MSEKKTKTPKTLEEIEESDLLSPIQQTTDGAEVSLRPKSLSEFVGQEKVKNNLNVFIKAAKNRGEALDHVFLSSPPGLGKTTLATIIANEMSSPIRYTSAPSLEKPKDLVGILTSLTKGCVFFIDEIHRLKPQLEEMLYIAMEDFEVDWVVGTGPSARTLRVPIEPFTLIGATTKAGNVSSPLINRFGITARMDYYPPNELFGIIKRSAGILNIGIDDKACTILSECSRGTPRIANRILRRVRDCAEVEGVKTIDSKLSKKVLNMLEINSNGLEAQDINILTNLIKLYGGGPVGAQTLAISIGEGVDTLEDFYEPYLIQQGFLTRTPRGRMVTNKAYELLGIKDSLF